MDRRIRALAALTVAALVAAGCTEPGTAPGDEVVTLTIGVDLPFQGVSQNISEDTWNALLLYLEQVGSMAGAYPVQLTRRDNSAAARGSWDEATCRDNATEAVATENQVAVLGTYNNGCSAIEAPILNQAEDGPMLMVSHANTGPGLTRQGAPGEPQKHFPIGERNFARVITTDDLQGPAAAQFAAAELKVTKCFVLNDSEAYGQEVARTFAAAAREQGIAVVGEASWSKGEATYIPLFDQARSAGADCVFVGGIYDNNGGQLVKDKVAALGDNEAVKLLVPDGFVGYPDFLALPESAGAYLTFAGLPTDALSAGGGAPAAFVAAFTAKYGHEPRTDYASYALYGVQALQVILAAIAKSDGTRQGVRDAVFEGEGITIAAGDAILGKEIAIDPATGDVSPRDIAVEIVEGGQSIFRTVWPVP